MKTILAFSIRFSAITLPVLGELTEADLNEIRWIVREEIKKETTTIHTKIDGLETGVFDAQSLVTVSEAKFLRKLGNLQPDPLSASP